MKTYVKPDVFYENFELSTSVAACGLVLNANGSLKKDNTEEQLADTIVEAGGFSSGACSFSFETYGVYGENIVLNS